MSTWADLIALIFRDSGVLGVGQTLQAQDTSDAVRRINMMLSQWKRRRWLVPNLVDYSILQDGSLFYTIGAGGDIDVARPNAIESAFMRQAVQSVPNQVDWPLTIIDSMEQYSALTLKNMQAGPSWFLFFDSGWPLGKLYPWPLAGGSAGGSGPFELHIQVKSELDSVGSLAAEINLPPEFEEAIYFAQMAQTRAAYRLPPDPYIQRQLKITLQTLRSSQFQVPNLNMPRALRGRGGYNIWADSWGPGGR
jgi:hypothetical protein